MSNLWCKLWFTSYALIWALSSGLGFKSKLESEHAPVCSYALIWAISSDFSFKSKLELGYVPVCSQRELRAPWFDWEPELVVSESLNAPARQSLCCQRPSNRLFSDALHSLGLSFQRPFKIFLGFDFLRVQCSTCRVASTLTVALSQHLCSLFVFQCLHAFAPDRAATTTLAFPTFF